MKRLSPVIAGRGDRLSYLFGRLCDRIPGVSYVRHVLVVIDRDQLPAMPRGYVVRSIDAAELAGYRIDADAGVQAGRFAAGMVCLGAFDSHGAMVGVTWLEPDAHAETVLRVQFRLPADACWDGGLWIDEERRLSRAFVAIWAGVGLWLDAQGKRRSVSSIADYNAASIAAHRRLGARTDGHVAVFRIGSMQLTMGGRIGLRATWGARWPEVKLEPVALR